VHIDTVIPNNLSQEEQIIKLDMLLQSAHNIPPELSFKNVIIISRGPIVTTISPELSFQNQINYMEYIVRNLILQPQLLIIPELIQKDISQEQIEKVGQVEPLNKMQDSPLNKMLDSPLNKMLDSPLNKMLDSPYISVQQTSQKLDKIPNVIGILKEDKLITISTKSTKNEQISEFYRLKRSWELLYIDGGFRSETEVKITWGAIQIIISSELPFNEQLNMMNYYTNIIISHT